MTTKIRKGAKKKRASRPLQPLVRASGEHHFFLKVKTQKSKDEAWSAVLNAFSLRQPDGCEFRLLDAPEMKEAWMEGAAAGAEVAFEALARSFDKLKTTFQTLLPNDHLLPHQKTASR